MIMNDFPPFVLHPYHVTSHSLLVKRYNRRQIALRVAYLGEAYQGFALQSPPAVTVEVM